MRISERARRQRRGLAGLGAADADAFQVSQRRIGQRVGILDALLGKRDDLPADNFGNRIAARRQIKLAANRLEGGCHCDHRIPIEVGPSHQRINRHGDLPVFDDLGRDLAARLAFEGALVVVGPVGLDAGKPHRCAACGASRVFMLVK